MDAQGMNDCEIQAVSFSGIWSCSLLIHCWKAVKLWETGWDGGKEARIMDSDSHLSILIWFQWKPKGWPKDNWLDHGLIISSAQSCPTLCSPMDCSTPAFPVHHQFLELAQTHVHRVGDAIQPSHPLSSPSPAFSLSQNQHPMNQFFTSGDQSIGVSASASVLPMNIQDWFPLGLTGWISL